MFHLNIVKSTRLNFLSAIFNLSHTCHFAAICHPDSTEAVIGHGSDLSCTPRAMMVVTVSIRVGHGVRIIRV